MVKVIFPSAKVVTKELQSVGKLPAIIYPVDQMRMIDLFYELYMEEQYEIASLNVIAYEEYSQIEKRTGRRGKVNIIKLDELKDLGYTVSFGIKKSGLTDEDELIINFADVAIFDQIQFPVKDRCFYSNEDISSKWTYFKENNGCITDYYDKPEVISGIDTSKMFIGIFHIAKPMSLAFFIDEAFDPESNVDSLWPALMNYSSVYPFEMLCTDEWFDIGHIDRYFDMQMAIKSRTFNHITIDRNRGILTKTSDDKEKFRGEIQWYLKLPADVEYARPRIFSYSMEFDNPYVSMEYYAYHTLHELFLFGNLSDEQWKNIFRRIRFILNDFRRYSVKDDNIKNSLREMYLNKTLKRLKQMEGTEGFPEPDGKLVINGVSYITLGEMYTVIENLTEKYLLDTDEFNIIHGDLCFSNIMIDMDYSFVKLIDPRGGFGRYDIYGDRRYELAKLMHSIDGKYDYIIKDKFHLSGFGGIFSYNIDYDQSANIEGCFLQIFQEELEKDGKAIKLIESLLFFSMIPLHSESSEQQKVMLGTAVKLLDSVCDIKLHGGIHEY